jgi:hypothetical protein
MVKILSFDVGIKNLAYCVFESDTSKILNWGILDLNGEGFSAKVPSGNKNIAKAANDIHIQLIKQLDSQPFMLETDYVVVEKQPSFNPKMRIIGGCLQSYFYIRGIVDRVERPIKGIEFFSPKHKLKCYTGPELVLKSKVKSKYAQTKKMGIMIAQEKLEEFDEQPKFKEQFEKSKKKDDLADCYLQAITYSLFKKFKVEQTIDKIVEKVLTKPQIKKQLKEYLDSKVRVYNINELMQKEIPKNLIEAMNNVPLQLKKSLYTKYNINTFTLENTNSLFTDLSMKTYYHYHYDLTPGFISNKKC